jgi:hypothetical protein
MMKAMPNRPHLPERLKRAVFMEAGRRCAIPTCRRIPVDLAHIEPRKPDGSNDTFENLIALCGNCHDMYDRPHLIDRTAMRGYKQNLGVLTSRYSDMERRLLELFSKNPTGTVQFQDDMAFPFYYLLEDGYLALVNFEQMAMAGPWRQGIWHYALTDHGRELLDRWLAGQPVG